MEKKLILASASARRRKILTALGADFAVMIPDIKEVFYEFDAQRAARENAARKSAWCRRRRPDCYILAADTVIEFKGRCFAKARTMDEAIAFLEMFSGATHLVYTAVAMARPQAGPELILAKASVRFRVLSEEDIRQYVSTVKPIDRAGAYDIDDRGEELMESYTGSRTTIMGFPEDEIRAWLIKEGLARCCTL